jgi:hypothetical protein
MNSIRSFLFALSLALFLSGSAVAQPEFELYGVADKQVEKKVAGDTEGSKLYQIDYVTAESTLVGPTGFRQCTGLDFHPKTNELYAVCERIRDRDQEDRLDPQLEVGQVLVVLDRFTGEGTEVVPIDLPEAENVTDISFRSDGALFAHIISRIRRSSEDETTAITAGPGNYIGVIEMQSGVVAMIGPTGYEDMFSGIGFSLRDILFHGVDDDIAPAINVLSQATGAPIVTRPLIYPGEFGGRELVTSMDVMPVSGDLYAVVYTEDETKQEAESGVTSEILVPAFALSIINPVTGGVAVVGDTVQPMTAIAFLNKEREINIPYPNTGSSELS